MSEAHAADLRARAAILSRQRRRAWAALLILAADMIVGGRRSAMLSAELSALAAAAEAQGCNDLADAVRRLWRR